MFRASCPECQQLEVKRSSWIDHYTGLIARRKLCLIEGRLPAIDLNLALARAESELKLAGDRLAKHCAGHSLSNSSI